MLDTVSVFDAFGDLILRCRIPAVRMNWIDVGFGASFGVGCCAKRRVERIQRR